MIAEPSRSAHLAAMRISKKSGCLLSYDPNLRLALWPSAETAREAIMGIWDQADIIKVWELLCFYSADLCKAANSVATLLLY